ncbi:MAG TPA: phage minor head protein, partial [Ktedonobacterales bacterium]|nr:phage minor head protein [Ktedonobacterales bacterium]
NRPNPDAMAAWVGRSGNGHPLGDLFANFGAEAASSARKEMLLGLALGANPRAMAQGIANALGISRSRATIIARTEVLGSYRAAQMETYRANSDVVSGWVWSAGGPNPCAACMGMDGLQFTLEEELIDHPCGACAALPVTRSWDDILGPLGIDASGMDETSIGEEDAYFGGEDRFNAMSPAQQRAVIGTNTGYEAWRRGEVSLRDFAGRRADGMLYQKSLRELQIPTRQSRTLVEPSPRIAGPHRASARGQLTPLEQMPAWAKQSEAARIVYQILRNGLPYDLMSHEQGLLVLNLIEMLKDNLPPNVRLAVIRQLRLLGADVPQ